MRYELVVFDMDGTLVEGRSCWRRIHNHFGSQAEASKNLEKWEKGIISYPEFMRRDISLWEPKPHISQIEDILSQYRLPPRAYEVFEKLEVEGCEVAIISGGIDILAEKVSEDLGIDHIFANGLETDEDGYLTGEGIFRVDPENKSDILIELSEWLGIDLDDCFSVGDSVYDQELLSLSGMGVAIGGDGIEIDSADYFISDFEKFDKILNFL